MYLIGTNPTSIHLIGNLGTKQISTLLIGTSTIVKRTYLLGITLQENQLWAQK
jgi:hypothetical protein